MPLDTPVVIFFFNRPRQLERTFARVRDAQPKQLLLVADGPRPDRPDEAKACSDCHSIVKKIDWHCEVERCYAQQNMGCRDRIASGIREAFSRYESAIFLEDDCLPRPSFFLYCHELLGKYEADADIAFISGTRFIHLPPPKDHASYQFCHTPLVWGWASWRRALENYDERITDWPEQQDTIRAILADDTAPLGPAISERVTRSVISALSNCHAGTLDTWDHPLAYLFLKRGMKCLIPQQNMITNMGFGPLSTHSDNISSQAALHSADIQLPLKHPATTDIDTQLNARVWKNTFLHPMDGEPTLARLIHTIKRSLDEFMFRRSDRG